MAKQVAALAEKGPGKKTRQKWVLGGGATHRMSRPVSSGEVRGQHSKGGHVLRASYSAGGPPRGSASTPRGTEAVDVGTLQLGVPLPPGRGRGLGGLARVLMGTFLRAWGLPQAWPAAHSIAELKRSGKRWLGPGRVGWDGSWALAADTAQFDEICSDDSSDGGWTP